LTPRVLSQEDKEGLGVAFEEAALLGAEIDSSTRRAGITLSVLTLPEVGDEPEDRRLQILLLNVGRAAASLRLGRWDDSSAPLVAFPPEKLLEHVQEFGGCALYGWEFFDIHERELSNWYGKFSFDVSYSTTDGNRHSLCLFQDGGDRFLDFCIWFDELLITNAAGQELPIEDVIAGGKRWWKALHEGDPRTASHGIFPLKGDAG
jgi:hypothetical protein